MNALGANLEAAWAFIVGSEGYPAPTNTNEYLLDIYLGNTGDGAPDINFLGAYTTMYETSPYMSYIVIHPDIISFNPVSQEIAAHEFFHTIQFGIVFQSPGFCFSGQDDFWWWEATSMWMEDVVYPDLNYYASAIDGYAEAPHLSLYDSSFMLVYSRVIFAKYLSENRGGNKAIHSIWTTCSPSGVQEGIDSYLREEQDWNLDYAYEEFVIKNTVMDYQEGYLYPDVVLYDLHDEFPVLVETINAKDRPRDLGASFIVFQSPGPLTGKALRLAFDGEDESVRQDVQWSVMLTLVSRNGYEPSRIKLDEKNRGEALVKGFGDSIIAVYMIPTVLNRHRSSSVGVNYKYFADIVDEENDEDSDSSDDDPACGGCHSGQGRVDWPGAILMVGLLLALGAARMAKLRR